MTLVWRARALNDLRSLFAHIARYTDPGHAYEVLADLRTQIEALLDQHALGRRGHQRGTRYLIVRVGTNTYRVLYRVSGQRIIVVRVRDTRQEGASTQ